MKIVSQEEADAHHHASIMGGVRGGATGALVSAIVFPILYRKTNYYRTLPAPLKAFGAVFVVVPFMIINAEKAGREFQAAQWTGIGLEQMHREERLAEEAWQGLSEWDQRKAWAKEHQYSLVGAAWAVCMAGSIASVWRRPGLTTMQKLINARIIAQTLTVGLMLTAMGLTAVSPEEKKLEVKEPDHTWSHILDASERENKQREVARAREKLLHAHELFQSGKTAAQKVVV
ncbi:hypothetical protein BDY24DRAFT_416011 [Mrakia frigida]|uniref:HIG1 domain-containing protein n=1 Tax=Mrakia frigida TaxID=29902 RepID=UPI003FCC1019